MNRAIYRLLRFNHKGRQWLTQYLTPTGLSVLVALFVFGLISLDIRRSVSYQVFAFLLALLATSALLRYGSRFGRRSRDRLRATRHLPRFGTVGVPLRYRIVIDNRSKKHSVFSWRESFENAFPSFYDFQQFARAKKRSRQDWFKLLARQQRAVASPSALLPLAGESETEVVAELLPLRRGLLSFGALILTCPEPLGLMNRCITLSLAQTVLVLPKRYQLPALDLPGARCYQADGLALVSALGDSEEFRALRDYRPGDSVRKIHWKSWAKTGRPIIKEEQSEYSVRHALVLDTFQLESYSEIMEEAVAIAASFAYTIQTQESLLDMVFVNDQAHCFTAGRGLGQTERLLELLASVVLCQNESFSALLPIVRSRLSLLSGCICIFLTWDCDRQALIEQLQAANIPTLALIVAPAAGLSEPIDRSCLRNSQSSIHVLHIGRIQQDLWNL
ncbi:MAG: DUF58 domain-containing protein [Cyanobacteria bacterium P01_D01_bin.1]